jgi:uncharacterized iron-regulated membrane protein
MDIFHFGLFWGIWGRIIYFCVGLVPTILLATGFVMWQYRRKKQPTQLPFTTNQ